MLLLAVSRVKSLIDIHARNVAAKIAQELLSENTAKIHVRIVGAWNVMDTTASILKSLVQLAGTFTTRSSSDVHKFSSVVTDDKIYIVAMFVYFQAAFILFPSLCFFLIFF